MKDAITLAALLLLVLAGIAQTIALLVQTIETGVIP